MCSWVDWPSSSWRLQLWASFWSVHRLATLRSINSALSSHSFWESMFAWKVELFQKRLTYFFIFSCCYFLWWMWQLKSSQSSSHWSSLPTTSTSLAFGTFCVLFHVFKGRFFADVFESTFTLWTSCMSWWFAWLVSRALNHFAHRRRDTQRVFISLTVSLWSTFCSSSMSTASKNTTLRMLEC